MRKKPLKISLRRYNAPYVPHRSIDADMEVPAMGSWSAIGTFVLGGVVLLYLYLTHNHSYWRKRGVPYVKPLPLFGNMKDTVLSRKSMGENYKDIYW